MQIDEQTDELILRLEPAWGRDKAEKLKLIHAIGDEERKERLSKILKLSASKLLNDSLLPDQPMMPPSTKEECGQGEITLGQVCYGRNSDGTDRILYPLRISRKEMLRHMIISGMTGSGKTCLAYNIVIQLAMKRDTSIIVFDWNRTWRNLLSLPEAEYPFVKDIKVFTAGRDISPLRYNIFFSPPPKTSNLMNWFGIIAGKPLQRSLLGGLGVENLIINEAENLLEGYQQGKLRLLPNTEDMKKRIEAKFLRSRESLWQQSAIRILTEISRQSTVEIFGSRTPISIAEQIIDYPGITIIEMDIEFPPHLRVLLQEVILNYIMLHQLQKGETETLSVAIILEECQNMIRNEKEKTTGDILQNLWREGRKLGISVTSLFQESSIATNEILANSLTQIHFTNTTYKDISTIANALFLKPHQIPYIDTLTVGEAMAKIKGRIRNSILQTPQPPLLKKITDEQLKEIAKGWQEKN